MATAPGDQSSPLWNRRYKNVGAGLFAYAVLLSRLNGHAGRIGLHADGGDALNYYRHIATKVAESGGGMLFHPEKIGVDGPTPRGSHESPNTYLEKTKTGAAHWLEDYRCD